jgi:hypothetical protein
MKGRKEGRILVCEGEGEGGGWSCYLHLPRPPLGFCMFFWLHICVDAFIFGVFDVIHYTYYTILLHSSTYISHLNKHNPSLPLNLLESQP